LKQLILWLIAIMAAFLPNLTFARPVSYPDGWTLMGQNDSFENTIHLHYTPQRNFSVGYKTMYNRVNHAEFHGIQLNTLLKRINKRNSQANFYLKSGIGTERLENNMQTAAGFIGFAADWEDRDYFIMYENHYHDNSGQQHEFMQKARIGITPYVGSYGDLHTWIMLQAEHRPNALHSADQLVFTPMIRLFYGDYLAEFGISDRKKAMFNFTIRH